MILYAEVTRRLYSEYGELIEETVIIIPEDASVLVQMFKRTSDNKEKFLSYVKKFGSEVQDFLCPKLNPALGEQQIYRYTFNEDVIQEEHDECPIKESRNYTPNIDPYIYI